MRFPHKPPTPEARPHRVSHPWDPPETEFPGIVPIDTLQFDRSKQAAIAITGMSAYTTGFEFVVTRIIQRGAPGWDGGLMPSAPKD